MGHLAQNYTIAVVTPNIQQASRVSDYTAFFILDENCHGNLVEYGKTQDILTEYYISGRFG